MSRGLESTGAAAEREDLAYWLALLRIPRIGTRRLLALLAKTGSPAALFEEPPGALAALGLKKESIDYLAKPDWSAIEKDLDWLRKPGRTCVTLADAGYPRLLAEIPDPPPVVFVLGHVAALSLPQIALVGSRNPSPLGQRLARQFAVGLSERGLAITSGLAVGVDIAAHEGALARSGTTIAVVGTGLDRVYPRHHHAYLERIAAQGAIVSEFALGTPPKGTNFPRRNRIISGLSLGTLVVEATLRSGSLITARLASEQGREVFAMPGSLNNPLAQGCHALIKEGAKLVECIDDILVELKGLVDSERADNSPASVDLPDDPDCQRLLKFVACEPTSVDTLVAATGSSVEEITYMMAILELRGYVASTAGGCFYRII